MYIVLMERHIFKGWYFCFNTNTFEWEEENALNLQNSLNKIGVTFEDDAVCVSGIENLYDNLNVIIYKDRHETVIAYLIDDSGSLVCYQELNNDLYLELDTSRCSGGISLINHKSCGGRMCLVIKVYELHKWEEKEEEEEAEEEEEDKGDNFVIRHFELKLKEGFEEQVKKWSTGSALLTEREFLTIEIYKDQWFGRTGFRSGLDIRLRNAFFF